MDNGDAFVRDANTTARFRRASGTGDAGNGVINAQTSDKTRRQLPIPNLSNGLLSVILVLGADLAGAVGYILDAAADALPGVIVAVGRHGRWRGAAVFDLAQPAPAISGVLGRVGRALGQGGACAVHALFEDE